MIDIQSSKDDRGILLDFVGVKELKLPFTIKLKKTPSQAVHANVEFYTELPAHERGIHMSRIFELLNKYTTQTLDQTIIKKMCKQGLKLMKSNAIYINLDFDIFISKVAPVSALSAPFNYGVKLENKMIKNQFSQSIILTIPVMLLCPCSKAISENNAHNQRTIITLRINNAKNIDVNRIIKLVENEASCHLYPILKRVDEKFVTEHSYDNPKFVEDIARDIAVNLKKIEYGESFVIECESLESIHNHNAYAKISYTHI